jgi:hypothetical protein
MNAPPAKRRAAPAGRLGTRRGRGAPGLASLRAKSSDTLRDMRRDTKVGLGFMPPASPMRAPAQELLNAIEAELTYREYPTRRRPRRSDRVPADQALPISDRACAGLTTRS